MDFCKKFLYFMHQQGILFLTHPIKVLLGKNGNIFHGLVSCTGNGTLTKKADLPKIDGDRNFTSLKFYLKRKIVVKIME